MGRMIILQMGLINLALALLKVIFYIFHLLYCFLIVYSAHSYIFVIELFVLFVDLFKLFQFVPQIAYSAAAYILLIFT